MPTVRLFLLATLLYAATSIASQLGPPPAHASPPLTQSAAHVLPDDAQLEADGARLVIDQARAASEIEHMRGAGSGELSTDEILALTRA